MKANESPYSDIEWVSTGFSSLDKILGGGVPLRKITEISGKFSVGKSTLALIMVAQAQKEGREALWVDAELSYDLKYAEYLGVNNSTLDLIQAPSEDDSVAEYYLDQTLDWARGHENAIIVLDSIGGLVPREEMEKASGERVIGGQAKLIASFVRKITPILAINNLGLIVINHDVIDLMSGVLKTSGGEKLGYHKSIWLRMSKAGKKVMQGEEQIGELIQCEIRKNKLSGTYKQSCGITMMFGQGFSKEADLLQDALDKGVITKEGRTYFFEGNKLCSGMPALRELFKDASFAAKVNEKIKG